MCADEQGVSRELTQQFLGSKAAANTMFDVADLDLTEFTFANGLFCDVKERFREDRYYGENGQRSGAVSKMYTNMLFGE